MNDWLPIVSTVTNVGFAVVVAWYLLAKGIPTIQDRFSADLDRHTNAMGTALKEQRDDFSKAITQMQAAGEKVIALIVQGYSDQARHHEEKIDRLIAMAEDNRKALERLTPR